MTPTLFATPTNPDPWRPIGLTWAHVVIAIALVLTMVAVAVAAVIWGPWALVVGISAICVVAWLLCWRAS
jgi:hypothetical protein